MDIREEPDGGSVVDVETLWGVFTANTGQSALVRTYSATLPMMSRASPGRPWVPTTIKRTPAPQSSG